MGKGLGQVQVVAKLERTLPVESYLSPDVYAREVDAIFASEWFCAGREEEVPEVGNFLHLNVAGQSVLVVRTRAGTLAAFYNVCRHRGAELFSGSRTKTGTAGRAIAVGPTGSFKGVIRCPYHSWTYELDGSLRNPPFLDVTHGVKKSDLPLYPVGIALWAGFFFLNLTPREAGLRGHTLERQIGNTAKKIERYPLSDLRTAYRIVYHVAVNWKVLAENYNECYHCGSVHPELCRIVPAFKAGGGSGLDWDDGIPHREGAWTFTTSGSSNRAPFPGLSEKERTHHKGEIFYPNLWLSLAADHVAAFTLWPQSVERTTVICDFLFHPAEIEKSDFDPMDAVDFWDLVNEQDWAICESVQRGMHARPFQYGFYAPMEHLNLDIRRYLAERLKWGGVPGRPVGP